MAVTTCEPQPTTARPIGYQDLLTVLRDGGPASHLQPVVDLTRANVVGYECLARFPGPQGPWPWLQAARARGLSAEVEAAALRAALAHRSALPRNTFLSVNVSPDLLSHRSVQHELSAGGSLAGIVVELTEDARIDSYAAFEAPLRELREAGATIAIDDAGAGYAGLRHLLHLRPDFVKIDRDIVAGLDQDEAKRAMVEMLGALAGRMDAWVIAEGVETEAELAVLVDLGVPLAQGFLLGRPAPGCAGLDPAVAASIRSRVVGDTGPSLRVLVESAPTAAGRAEAERLVGRDAGPVVVLDASSRPLGTVRPDGSWWSARDGSLVVNVDTPVGDAAGRAVTRAAPVRFDPVVCTDDAGRFLGVVRMERLVDALVRS